MNHKEAHKLDILMDLVLHYIHNTCYHSGNLLYEPWHEISKNVVCATSKGSDQPAHTHSLNRAFAGCLNVLLVLSYWLNIGWSF